MALGRGFASEDDRAAGQDGWTGRRLVCPRLKSGDTNRCRDFQGLRIGDEQSGDLALARLVCEKEINREPAQEQKQSGANR
jgi:hypothetical protein